jgi:hypothetical protein
MRGHRSKTEEKACQERWGRDDPSGVSRDLPAPLALAKRAAFDAQARRQDFKRDRPLAQPFVPCKGVGSNLGPGCLNGEDR